jgi:hypothetical protein
MSLTPIPDHYLDLVDIIITQFRDKYNYNELLKIFSKQVDEIEVVIFQLLNDRWLDTAIGEQLDILGRILVLDRAGRDDETYRRMLKAKAYINTTNGEPESIINALLLISDTITEVIYEPAYPAGFHIWTDGDIKIYYPFDFTLDNGDTFILDNGDTFIVTEPDPFTNNLLTDMSPAGVEHAELQNLLVEDTFYLGISTGGHLLING